MSDLDFIISHSSYMPEAFEPIHETVKAVERLLEGVEYDTLIGTGLSGALVVPRVADALDKRWAIVRKPNDGSHSYYEVEGHIGKRWVFLDDFVDSGETRERVFRAMRRTINEHNRHRSNPFPCEYVGTCEYHYRDWLPRNQHEHRARVFDGTTEPLTSDSFASPFDIGQY